MINSFLAWDASLLANVSSRQCLDINYLLITDPMCFLDAKHSQFLRNWWKNLRQKKESSPEVWACSLIAGIKDWDWEHARKKRFGTYCTSLPRNLSLFAAYALHSLYVWRFSKFCFIYVISVTTRHGKNWSNGVIFESQYCKQLWGDLSGS